MLAALAMTRQRQGRSEDAIALCAQAIAEGEGAGEERAVAHACHVLDWALHDAGRPEEATHSARALAIYERLGDLDRQAAVLNNLGAFAFHAGDWREAVVLYRRAANASAQAGDVVNAAFGDCNVGEVLVEQGRLTAADEALRAARARLARHRRRRRRRLRDRDPRPRRRPPGAQRGRPRARSSGRSRSSSGSDTRRTRRWPRRC